MPKPDGQRGIKRLVQKCRDKFRRPENTHFYASKDYRAAERKFVKYCLKNRQS